MEVYIVFYNGYSAMTDMPDWNDRGVEGVYAHEEDAQLRVEDLGELYTYETYAVQPKLAYRKEDD